MENNMNRIKLNKKIYFKISYDKAIIECGLARPEELGQPGDVYGLKEA